MGPGVLCRGYLRVLFSGFYSQKGANLSSLAVGGQNVFSTYPAESARAMSVGEKYSEYTPWGFNGSYYYVRLSYKWGN